MRILVALLNGERAIEKARGLIKRADLKEEPTLFITPSAITAHGLLGLFGAIELGSGVRYLPHEAAKSAIILGRHIPKTVGLTLVSLLRGRVDLAGVYLETVDGVSRLD